MMFGVKVWGFGLRVWGLGLVRGVDSFCKRPHVLRPLCRSAAELGNKPQHLQHLHRSNLAMLIFTIIADVVKKTLPKS